MSAVSLFDYNLARVQLVIGGDRIQGFSADDAIAITKQSDDFSFDLSVDGAHGSRNRINDNTRLATLKVRRGSTGYRLLADKYVAQLRASDAGSLPDLGFTAYDPDSGDKVAERRCFFMKGPDMPFAKSAGEAVFTILLPNPTVDYGPNVPTTV